MMKAPKRVLLDTNLFIAAMHKNNRQALKYIADLEPDQYVVSAITYVEFAVGETGQRKLEQRSLQTFFKNFLVLPVLKDVWVQAGREATRLGARAGQLKAPDLLIAATALVTGRTVVTDNISDFELIQGLTVVNWKV
jgi:predicted nucleic acid-binding protein